MYTRSRSLLLWVAFLGTLVFAPQVSVGQAPPTFTTQIGFSVLSIKQTVVVSGASLTLTFQQQTPLLVNNAGNAICTDGTHQIVSSSVSLVVNWGDFQCTPTDFSHTLLTNGSLQFVSGVPQYVVSITQGSSIQTVGNCRTIVLSRVNQDGSYFLIVNASSVSSNSTFAPNQWMSNGTYSLYAASNPCSSGTGSGTSSSSTSGGNGGTVLLVVVTVNGDSTTLNKTRSIDAFAQATGINPALITVTSIVVLGRRRSASYSVTLTVASPTTADQTAVESLTQPNAPSYSTFVSASGLDVQSVTVQQQPASPSSSDAARKTHFQFGGCAWW